ncbi:YbaB/EbfC DNA-binding family protein [Tamaricihabitans halophyticus]|uniref:YbaB/EbfC DNA-binding family protein n=1 Tax=Tamaricihabitans halophyticus TaxID=1262583 RepID=A0A4R2R5W3_9PSEU|nr:YbaB/EbfC family nucleoid-associated protein [Tamaricihabitans halophyticus]TCP57414.1 YbaB/EbfC DNA-binding family protein [Tamaricihabitans halophyticus]
MTEPNDPDAWQRNYEAKLANIAERNERMIEELEQVQATERSKDGQISVTVNNQGALADLQLGNALRQREGSEVAGEVLRLVSAAQAKVADAVRQGMEPYLGGTAAMDYVVDHLSAAQAPPEPQGFTPGGGGAPDAASFLRTTWENDEGGQDSPPQSSGPAQQPPQRPSRPTDDEDDDFGGGSILR